MKYRVIITDETLDQVERFLDYLAFDQHVPLTANRWWKKAYERICSLKKMPHRCPYAPENEDRDYDIRMLMVDRCLFLYHVSDKNRVVRILSFRHSSQQPRPDDLPDEVE